MSASFCTADQNQTVTQILSHGRLSSDPNDSVLDENGDEKAALARIEELDPRGSW